MTYHSASDADVMLAPGASCSTARTANVRRRRRRRCRCRYLANLFLAPSNTPAATPSAGTDAQATVDQLRHLVTEQQNSIDELERLLRAE